MLSISLSEMTSEPRFSVTIIEPRLIAGSKKRVAPFGPSLLGRLSLSAPDESISFDRVSCALQGSATSKLPAITS